MNASKKLIQAIKGFEGLYLKAYLDSKGVATIGWGHTQGVKLGQVITQAKAEEFLEHDLWVASRFPATIAKIDTQGKFDAVVDFIFNLGINNFKSSTLYRKILAGAPDKEIQAEFNRWVYATNKKTGKKEKMGGLVKRRAWEAQRWAEKT